MMYEEEESWNSIEESISKGREVEEEIQKIIKEARVEKLILGKHYKKMARDDDEMVALKRKYNHSQTDFYQKRDLLIQSIPNFWSTAFLNHDSLKDHLTGDDEKIIKFLNTVLVQDDQIIFLFDKNPYFENEFLTKSTRKISGTKILWKDTTTGAQTEIPDLRNKSFFTRFFDPQRKDRSKNFRKEVIKAIEEHLWPYALVHFLDDQDKLKKVRLYKNALDELESIQYKLDVLECDEYIESNAVERKFEKKALEHQAVIEQNCNKELRPLYQKRNEIVKAIPNFWLLAFLSHYALGDLLRDEDQKIFRLVDSMEVEVDEDGVSGYIITLNFNDKNHYFTNRRLTKRISFCEDGTTNLSAVKIDWNDDMNIATEYLDDIPGIETSFFTWFCAPQVLRDGYKDEVSELIKDEFLPNALEYFVNGDDSDEEDEPKRRRGMIHQSSI